MREEIAQHAALRQRAFEAEGLAPAAAAAATARTMGNVTVSREGARRVWSLRWFESVWQDLAFAWRSMRRQPAFSVAAVLGLAGGLGFGAAAFSAFNALALRGWDVPERDRLVALFATSTGAPGNRRSSGFSYDQMQAFATRATTLDGVFAWERTHPDGTGSITTAPVSASYFSVLRVPMAMGRAFTADEDRPGAPSAVIVLSNAWWRNELDSSASVLGTAVRVNGVPFTVIGVVQTARVGELRPLRARSTARSTGPTRGACSFAESGGRTAAGRRDHDHDPTIGVSTRPYAWYVEDALAEASGAAAMAGVLGVPALVLASVGTFGVVSFWVRQRQHDIGIRVASAPPGRTSCASCSVRSAAPSAGACFSARSPRSPSRLSFAAPLYGLSPLDPAAFGGALGVLLLSAVLATLLPSWHAIHVDPVESLRSD